MRIFWAFVNSRLEAMLSNECESCAVDRRRQPQHRKVIASRKPQRGKRKTCEAGRRMSRSLDSVILGRKATEQRNRCMVKPRATLPLMESSTVY